MVVKFTKKGSPVSSLPNPDKTEPTTPCSQLHSMSAPKSVCVDQGKQKSSNNGIDICLAKIRKKMKSAIRSANNGTMDGMTSHFQKSQKLIRRVSAANEKGKSKRILETQHMYFESYSARLIAVLRACQKKHVPVTVEEAGKLASLVRVRKNADEPIKFFFKKKSNGDYRPICIFGIIRTAKKFLCKDVLQVAYSIGFSKYANLTDFNLLGGRTEACQGVLDLVHKHNCKYFVVCDIKQYFEYFDHDAVKKELLLPVKVIENSVLIPLEAELVPTYTGNKHFNTSTVRRGVPQGSLTSNLVAATLLTPVIDQVPHHGRAVIYSDGILIGATSKSEANAILKALKSALLHSPVGPMYLKEAVVADLDDGFEFLGYRFQRRPKVFGGEFCARPSIRSRNNFSSDLLEKCLKAPIENIQEVAEQYKLNWLKSFCLWEMQELEKNYFFGLCIDIAGTVEYARITHGKNVDISKFSFSDHGCHYNKIELG